ncbi:MAG: hypothetical protein K2K54_08100, partial [Lachnospiraceae bacterium]|nr:hypothetical protein [Lachnospiraceae bacterium]
LQAKSYFSDTERFADLINGVIGSGQMLITPTDFSDMDSQTFSPNAPPTHNKVRKFEIQKFFKQILNMSLIVSDTQRIRKNCMT